MPDSYYNETYAEKYKRRTGYTFFQFEKPRTDTTKVTWANGVTFLEWQILKANSLNIDFNTVYGSTNSARDGFIPAIRHLTDVVKEPSGQYYIGLSKPLGDGITARLQLVFEGQDIVSAHYDEIFADMKADIADEALKQYYRQSKYDSITYNEVNEDGFIEFSDKLNEAIVDANALVETLDEAPDEFANYLSLLPDIKDAVDRYLEEGYTHDIGTIDERPAGMPVNEAAISRQDDIEMTLLNYAYDKDKQLSTMQVEVENKSDKDYTFTTGSFYMYVMNTSNIYDTVADENRQDLTVKAGEKIVVDLNMGPVYDTDTDMSLKFDGANKVYFSMTIKETE